MGEQGNKELVNSQGQADNHKGMNRTNRGRILTQGAPEEEEEEGTQQRNMRTCKTKGSRTEIILTSICMLCAGPHSAVWTKPHH